MGHCEDIEGIKADQVVLIVQSTEEFMGMYLNGAAVLPWYRVVLMVAIGFALIIGFVIYLRLSKAKSTN